MLVTRVIPQGVTLNRRKRRQPRPSQQTAKRSLDSVSLLQTSENLPSDSPTQTFAAWLKEQETAHDRRRKLVSLHDRYLHSLVILSSRYEHIKREAAVDVATGNDRGYENELKRLKGQKFKPWKTLKRVSECQTSFMGFRATCCDSQAVAVPIVCNDRLCPLCNAHRAEHFRSRVRQIFGMVDNAWLLTLTVPNVRRLTSETFRVLRKRLRAFLREQRCFMLGGVYSIECTYNRESRTWHPHIHVLVDLAGAKRYKRNDFLELKWNLEFCWLLLTQGKRRPGVRRWEKRDYQEWVAGVDPKRNGGDYTRTGQRRTIDLRPCTSDKKASYEVLKYITKAVAFVDDPDALAEFMNAVHGVRVIQTFGSCYGIKFEEGDLTETISSKKRCDCGQNLFEKIGVITSAHTRQGADGQWYIRDDAPTYGRWCRGSPHTHNSPEGVLHGV